MASTYELIDSTTLSSSASSVSFTSIDQSYRDLVLVVNAYSTTTTGYGGAAIVTVNSDTGANYPVVFMRGNGSTAASSSATGSNIYAGYLSNNDYTTSVIMQFLDFSATDKHKSILTRIDTAQDLTRAQASRWANTAAITSIDIAGSGGTLASGSTFYLYGIAS